MKKHIYLILLLLITSLFSMPVFSTGMSTIRYVRAFSGLPLYPDKNLSSPETVVLPYHSKVKVLEESNISLTLSGKNGTWIRVKCKNKKNTSEYYEGWCFSGYVTAAKPEIIYNVPMGVVVGTALQINKAYSNKVTKVESEGDDISAGTSHEYVETLFFSSDRTFKYSTSTSSAYYRGESFFETKDFTGTYKIIVPRIEISINESDEYNDTWAESVSGREERLLTILKGDGILLCAETKDKYLLINPEGDIYSADKPDENKK